MLKNYQRKTKLFELLGDANLEELNRKKQVDFSMTSLCNGKTLLSDEYVACHI